MSWPRTQALSFHFESAVLLRSEAYAMGLSESGPISCWSCPGGCGADDCARPFRMIWLSALGEWTRPTSRAVPRAEDFLSLALLTTLAISFLISLKPLDATAAPENASSASAPRRRASPWGPGRTYVDLSVRPGPHRVARDVPRRGTRDRREPASAHVVETCLQMPNTGRGQGTPSASRAVAMSLPTSERPATVAL